MEARNLEPPLILRSLWEVRVKGPLQSLPPFLASARQEGTRNVTNKWNLIPYVGFWNDSKEIVMLKKLGKSIEGLALIALVVLSKGTKKQKS